MADSPSELQLEIEKLERKHAENPEGRFFVPLANAYRKMGDVETAEALLRAGVERHPDYLSAHIVLGRCLADRGAVTEAEEEFRFVLAQDPQNLIALRTLGELAVAEGRTGEAAEWYQELLAVDPMNEDARQALDALGDAPPTPELETEFRSGAGWWQPEPEATHEGPPLFAGSSWAQEEPAGIDEPASPAGDDGGQWGGYGDLPALSPEAEPEPQAASEPAATPENEPAEEFHGQASEVVTETIAELYARQGLHDRAITVYRELIRRRGGDAVLEQRLAEVERRARAEQTPDLDLIDAEVEPLPTLGSDAGADAAASDLGLEPLAFEPSPPATEDAFASSFEQGFGDAEAPAFEAGELSSAEGSGSRAEEAPLPALTYEAAEASPKVTISRFLGDLVAWTPAALAPAAAQATPEAPATEAPAPAAPEAPPHPAFEAPAQPEVEPPVEPEQWSATVYSTIEVEPEAEATEEGEPLPFLDTGVEPEAEADESSLPYLEPVVDDADAFGTGSAEDEEPFPWELSGGVAAEVEDPSALPIDSHFAEEPEMESIAPEPPASEPASGARGGDAGAAPAASAEPAEDEDLESFQAWLRSLKR